MVRFSEKETCKLVELYRNYECLWNPKHVHYRNRQVNLEACAEIAREMNHEEFTTADVKTKLKALRGTYNQELIKIKRSTNQAYRPNIKWFYLMETFIQKLKQSSGDNSLPEITDQSTEDMFTEDSQWEQLESNSETKPLMPGESVIEQSVRSISEPEVITVTPEFASGQCVSNSGVYSVIPEIPNVQPVSQSQVTLSPEILTVKAVSNTEVTPASSTSETVKSVSNSESIPVTSGVKFFKTVPNSEITTAPSIIQAGPSTSHQKYFTLIPEKSAKSGSNPKYFMLAPDIQTVKPVSNTELITGSLGNNQNVRYVPGSQFITLPPEIQPRVKRRLEEVSSSTLNSEICQNNTTKSGLDDFGDRNDDEMEAFGHFVALNLKKMSIQSALSAQTEILSILTRYRLNNTAPNVPSNQIFPCILTNGNSPPTNSRTIHKVFRKV